jgi:hypothetical protein
LARSARRTVARAFEVGALAVDCPAQLTDFVDERIEFGF